MEKVRVRPVQLRKPFTAAHLSLLSKMHATAYLPRRRLAKKLIGKPVKRLFHLIINHTSYAPRSSFMADVAGENREIWFNPRNPQFGAIYQPQNLPLYEMETSALLDALVSDGDVFFDIGANWGYYALYIASRPGFKGRIEAFEPYPPTYTDLVETVQQAGLTGTISCHSEALSDQDGSATMAPWDGFQTGLARLGEANVAADKRLEITTRKLDSMDLGQPQVIKIDVEDHEQEVLSGAWDLLAKGRPMIVFESWLDWKTPTITTGPLKVLSDHGYRFYIVGWAEAGGGPRCVPQLVDKSVSEATLALIPFDPESRYFFSEHLNILAVPEDRLATLYQLFSPLT